MLAGRKCPQHLKIRKSTVDGLRRQELQDEARVACSSETALCANTALPPIQLQYVCTFHLNFDADEYAV